MGDFFTGLIRGGIFGKTAFLMIAGLAGVFIVLAVFFFLIVVMEKVSRPKGEEPENPANG